MKRSHIKYITSRNSSYPIYFKSYRSPMYEVTNLYYELPYNDVIKIYRNEK